MPNTLDNIMPKILARGLLALREQAIMPRLVNVDYGRDAARKGQTIDVPLPQARTAATVAPGPTRSSGADTSPGLVQIQLNQWQGTDFFLTDKELVEIDERESFVPMNVSEAVRALANAVDTHIHGNYTGVYGYVGTAGSTPFSTVADATNVRKVLNQQLAPLNDRRLVMDPEAEAAALALAQFSDLEKTGDRAVKIEGELGRKFGLDMFMSQNIQTHTAGTAVSITVGSTTAAGVSAIDLRGSAAGTLVIGDIFTIAGDTQTYASQSSVTLASGANTAVTIKPTLQQIASSGKAVTKKATHVVNLGFQQNAFAFANRPLVGETSEFNDLGSRIVSATDPLSGISLRLEVSRQYKQITWEFDILWGSKLIRPELATRLAG